MSALRRERRAGRAPTPGCALHRLVDGRASRHGRQARARRGRHRTMLPEVVAAGGYRIVQEALTNVRGTPARAPSARVRVARRDGVVEVEVRDDGRGGGPPCGRAAGSPACANAPRRSAGSFEAGPRARAAASGSGRRCPWAPRDRASSLADDQALVRAGLPRAARRRATTSRSSARRRRRAAVALARAHAPRRRAHGHPHARRRTASRPPRQIAADPALGASASSC